MEIQLIKSITILKELRPMLSLDSAELNEFIDYIKDEIESKGGYEAISTATRKSYLRDVHNIQWELANRN